MADGLIIKVGADVGDAVSNLNKVDQAVNKTAQTLTKLPGATNQASQSLTNLNRVVQDSPYGFIGIANNINPLVESFGRLKQETGSVKGALSALVSGLAGPGGLALGFAAVTSAITFAQIGFQAWTRSSKAAKEESDKLAQGVANELVELTTLVGVITNVNTKSEDRTKALKYINQEYSKYVPALQQEGITLGNIADAYKKITDELLKQAVVKGLQDEIQKKVAETAAKIIKVQKQQEEARLSKEKEVKTNYELISSEKVMQRGLDGLNKTRNDGYLANQKQILSNKTAIGTFDAYGAVINNLKDELYSALKPLLSLTTSFTDLNKDLKDTKPEPLDFGLQNAFGELTILEGKLASAYELATFYTEKFKKEVKKAFKPLKEEKIEFRINLSEAGKEAVKLQSEWAKVGKNLQESLADSISQGVVNSLAAIGEGLGNLASGKGFGKQLFEVFGSLLQQIGRALIEFGVVKKIADNILKNPLFVPAGVALAAGVLAIASGTAIKNFGGAREFGGPVSGNKTYLVGEKGPELFVPSVSGTIIPNNQVGSMGGRAINGGGGSGRTIIRGNDIILSYARASRSQSRVNG